MIYFDTISAIFDIFLAFFHGYVLVAWHVRIRNESFFREMTVSHNLGLSGSDIAVAGSNPARQHSGTAEIFEGVNNSHSGYRPGTVG